MQLMTFPESKSTITHMPTEKKSIMQKKIIKKIKDPVHYLIPSALTFTLESQKKWFTIK